MLNPDPNSLEMMDPDSLNPDVNFYFIFLFSVGVPGVQQTRPKRQPHGGRILHGTRQVSYLYFNTFIYHDELIVASKLVNCIVNYISLAKNAD
jgi:hypothetical protein